MLYNSNQFSIRGATAFTSKEVAERAIGEALLHNWNKIEQWMVGGGQTYNVVYESNKVIGRGIIKPETIITDKTALQIRLVKYGKEFKIITAYPIINKKKE